MRSSPSLRSSPNPSSSTGSGMSVFTTRKTRYYKRFFCQILESGEAHGEHLEATRAAGSRDFDLVARRLADQGAGDRRVDRHEALANVGLVVADDLVADLGTTVDRREFDGRAEHHLAGVRQRSRVDDLRIREPLLDLLDAALDEALLLARGVVLGVLRKVAVRARLGDGADDGRPV